MSIIPQITKNSVVCIVRKTITKNFIGDLHSACGLSCYLLHAHFTFLSIDCKFLCCEAAMTGSILAWAGCLVRVGGERGTATHPTPT